MQAAAVGQPEVDERRRVVEPPPAQRGQPLGQPAYGVVVGEPHRRRLEAVAAVDEDLVRAVDQDVGDAGQPEQRLERPGAEHVAAQRLVDREHGRVADRAAGLAQRLGHPVRGQLAGPVGQPLADPVDDLRLDLRDRGHAATADGASRPSTSRAARGQRTAPRAHRAQPEVERLGQPALVGHRGEDR